MPGSLGAAAGLAALAVQSILDLCDLVDDLRDAPREAADLTMELKSLQAVLESIGSLAHAAGDDDADLHSELTALERAVQLCDTEVKTIHALILAVRHTNQMGRGIAKWLKRLISRLRMVLEKLQLRLRIRALAKRENAIRLTATAHQAPLWALSAPQQLAWRPSLPPRSGPAAGLSSPPVQPRAQAPAQTLALPAARASSSHPKTALVQPTTAHAPSPRPSAHTHIIVEVIEPAEYGACNGPCQSMDLFRSLHLGMPRSPWSGREIVEMNDETERSPRPVFRFPSADAASQWPRTAPRPSTPSSIPSLTRSTTNASCDTFATAQSNDQGANRPAPSCRSQSSSISGLESPYEPVTPLFPHHWSGRFMRHSGVILSKKHRNSIAKLQLRSDLDLQRNPEPYQGRDSDDED